MAVAFAEQPAGTPLPDAVLARLEDGVPLADLPLPATMRPGNPR